MLAGIPKYAIDKARQRASIPKFQVFNSALRNVFSGYAYPEPVLTPKIWGHFFESAIGAHIISRSLTGNYEVFYWREDNFEVDYVLQKEGKTVAIEVKSNADVSNKGLAQFRDQFHPHTSLVVGKGGLDAETFLSANPAKLFL